MRLSLHLPIQAKVVWLHPPLQVKAMARGFHAEVENSSITKQKKQESRSQMEDHQDFSKRGMRLLLHMPLQPKAVWLYCRYKTKWCGSICRYKPPK
jgi:hypothetical protein